LMSIIPSVIDRIVTQQSQLLSQFSQHAIHNEFHLPLTLPSPHRDCVAIRVRGLKAKYTFQ